MRNATCCGWLFAFLAITLPVLAQAQTTGQQAISINPGTITVEKVLQELEQQTQVKFSFSNNAIPLQKKVKLNGTENTVETVLQATFAGTDITWLYRTDQILLYRKSEAPAGASASGGRKAGTKATISGYVRESGSREALIGVTVFAPHLKAGITTNTYGFYSLTLPADSITLQFSYIGYKPQTRKLLLDRDHILNVELTPDASLQEVVIVAEERPRSTQTTQTSQVQVPVAHVKDMPAIFGEKDVLKTVQLLPGVQKGNEGASGLYVRGGGPDQNLIILDDATVYNASHALGFFSLFNGDALKSIDLTKGGFPARYGGRLSSVLEMNMKEGNKEEVTGEAGIGLVASRLTLEGPLKKNRSSFLLSGRRTYWDLLLRSLLNATADNGLGAYFYDGNVKVNYDFNRKHKVYLSSYFGRDKFYLDLKTGDLRQDLRVLWGNNTTTARWNHLINDRLFMNTSAIFSQYRFTIAQETETPDQQLYLKYFSGIRDLSLKSDLDFYASPTHFLKLGAIITYHYFTPNALQTNDEQVQQTRETGQTLHNLESALYLEDHFSVTPKLQLNSGLRLSHFYTEGRNYLNPEPRLAAAYRFTNRTALKASFATMNQYIHLLSSTGTGLPIDLWLPSTRRIRSQQSHQAALGLAQDLLKNKVALEIETYYKRSYRILAYREGANFLTINAPGNQAEAIDWESNLTTGQGWSYGAELLLQKKTGNFTGWLGYTLSRTRHQFDSLNLGRPFYARYDRRHDVSVTMAYQLKENTKLTMNWVYGTGNAITLPVAEYSVPYQQPNLAAWAAGEQL
ncbi:MAG TPA: TonB-dependent receptor, partial [Adhaeribacter sp.]|nr:TonB-dependent receptor [Adhaeribacter sp.]